MITSPTTPQPVDFADVRATNLAVVLRHVRAHAPCSRADIAAATGLNKATVSSLVADLLQRGLLRETGLTEHRVGRPATMLMLDGRAYAGIGMQLDTDSLAVVALDLAGQRLLGWRRSFDGQGAAAGKAVSAIAALARRALSRVTQDGRRVLGLALGVPGIVGEGGAVRQAFGWEDVDLRGQLSTALGEPAFPVTVDNDANLAVAAEHRWGEFAGTSHLIYLAGHAGMSAGIISGGQPLRGRYGFAGQLGHVALDPAGPLCGCEQRGCLESLAGLANLLRRALPDTFTDGPPRDWQPEVAEVARRAAAGDKVALAALAETGGWLGQGAAVLANLLNPEVVLLGGYYADLAEWLLPAAQEQLRQAVRSPEAGGTQLAASRLGHDATPLGGAARILTAVDAGNLPAATS